MDMINGTFEVFGGFMILNHCRVAIKDKQIAGVSIASTFGFAMWGIWNMFYYPHLGQWWSFAGGMFIVLTNFFWLYLMFKYRKPKQSGEYYLQDSRSIVGNDMLWWRAGSSGYTTNINEAATFTEDQAKSMHVDRTSDVPWLKSHVDSHTQNTINASIEKNHGKIDLLSQ